MKRIGIIGTGRVGTTFAKALFAKGYRISAVSSKYMISARTLSNELTGCNMTDNQGVADAADLVFITTPDDIITKIAEEISWHTNQAVIHCCGAYSANILSKAKLSGAEIGVLHPLQSFVSSQKAINNLPGTTFSIEAEGELLSYLTQLANILGGRALRLCPEERILYHAAAVMVSNYLVTIIKLAADMWIGPEKSTNEAVQAFIPLIRGTINNIEDVGIYQALTGPISRGDWSTVKMHLQEIFKKRNDLLPIYYNLGRETIPIAEAKGNLKPYETNKLNELLGDTACHH